MLRLFCVIAFLSAAAAFPALAHDTAATAPRRTSAATPTDLNREEKARQYFSDLPVITQDGERHRFYSDVLKDKIVLISFFFTECKDACPLINSRLAEVQELLGDRLGKDILLVSMTVDPDKDRPSVLKSYAQRFAARPGWLFLTGDKADVDFIIGRLGNVAPDPRGHATYVLLGNVNKARWAKVLPNIPEAAIVARLLALAADGAS
jgi:protein SCO1